jgi:hypothetical protein
MNAAILKRLLLVPMAVLLIAAVPLVDPPPVDTPAALTQKEVVGVLRKTLVSRGWLLTKDAANEIEAKLDVRTHSIKVRYLVAKQQITIRYLDSVNMDYRLDRKGNAEIHRKYPGWINNVILALNREMQLAVLAKPN